MKKNLLDLMLMKEKRNHPIQFRGLDIITISKKEKSFQTVDNKLKLEESNNDLSKETFLGNTGILLET